jgi:hypothetical protein
MQRRDFVILGASALGLVITPWAMVSCDSTSQWTTVLATPSMLGKFCSDAEIKEIGHKYCQDNPEEVSIRKIENNLLTQADGNLIEPDTNEIIDQHLSKLISDDFQRDQTVMIKGWVISRTEARQCALYFLTRS